MKLEHKIGIAITCTFLCLTGAVIGLKMQKQTLPQSPSVAAEDSSKHVTQLGESSGGTIKRDPKKEDPFAGFGNPPDPPDLKTLTKGQPKQNPAPPARMSSPPPATPGFRPPPPQKKDSPPPVAILANNSPSTDNKAAPAKKSPETGAIPITGAMNLEDLKKLSNSEGVHPPSPVVESTPTVAPVKGSDEWGRSPSGVAGDKNTKSVSPPSLPPQTNRNNQTKDPTASNILPVGGMETPNNPMISPALPTITAVSPPAPVQKGPGSGSPPAPTLPPFLSDRPANPSIPADPKAKEQTQPRSSPPPDKLQAMPNLVPPPVPPPALPAPQPQTSTPLPPPALLAPQPQASTTIPPPTPMPVAPPSPAPSPAAAPAMPLPTPIALPTPPKSPPADGSFFIPDKSPAAPSGTSASSGPSSGSASSVPAPFPLPTPPPAPLNSGPAKPAAMAATLSPPQPVSKGPSVTVYSEQEYPSQTGDSWASISKRYYLTDRYAKALQRHNQNHPRASDQLVRTGQLTPGTRIFIPQAYVLEERNADAIVKPSSTAPPTMVPTRFDPSASPPPPAPPPPNGSVPPPNIR